MRPLTLKVAGLRSYRNEEEVDFADRTLVAIVGDTGAGKSSLLEAITFALYGESTWSGQPGDLISDNVKTMRVELTFLAGGERWQATRAMSKDNYPAPIHRLKNLDTGEDINGKAAVKKRVEQLVGLDCPAFLKTVILPQGRFAELLTETKANRDRILKNLFRVDEIEAARDQAKALQDRLTPRLDLLRLARGNYLPDPVAAEADAVHRLDQARARADELDAVEKRIGELDKTASGALARIHELGQMASAVEIESAQEAAETLRRLAEAAGDLDGRIATAANEVARLDAVARKAQQALDDAQAGGLGISELNAANAALAAFDRGRGDAVTEIETIIDERLGAAQQEETVTELAAAAEGAARTAASRTAAASSLEAAAEAAKEAVRLAHEAFTVADGAQSRLVDLRGRVAGQQATVDEAETEAAEAATAIEEAAAKLATAETELRVAERAGAAAHAAEGLHTGDDCPVCDRPLPGGFEPPRSPELEAARIAHRAVVGEADKARTRKAKADASLVAERKALTDLEDDLGAQERVCGEAWSQVAERIGHDRHNADPSTVDAGTLLAPLKAEAEKKETASLAAKDEATEAEKEAVRVEAEHQAAVKKLTEMTARLDKLQQAANKSLRRLADDLAAIPSDWRPALTEATFEPDETTRQLLAAVDVTPAVEDVERRASELEELQNATNTAAKTRNEAVSHRDSLKAERQRLIEIPSQQAINVVHGFVSPLRQLANVLGAAAPTTPPDSGVELTEAADTTERLADQGKELLRTAEAAIGKLGADAASAQNDVAAALRAVEVGARDELVDARATALAEEIAAKADRERAQRETPIVADLEERTGQAERFLGHVRRVREMLADSKFIGYLINRRQQALLGVATTILDDITAGRFGFTADFMVLDKVSGQPRSPRTLSGGESFLASLALALGMVELAARAGGRLDALFLDEGFGALDTSSLDAAIDALERRARAGQLVAVISHVRAVAERIPDVLAVRSTPLGTRVRWMSDAERAEAVDEDVAGALSGLLA
jgi:exonuclease SbcC